MASTICGYCGAFSHMSESGPAVTPGPSLGGITFYQRAYECDQCQHLNLATSRGGNFEVPALTEWIPSPALNRRFEDVPPHIAGAASEGYLCLGAGAYRAAGAMARAVIEATAKEKGIVSGQVYDKIEEMFEQRLIREHIRDGAHEIRHFGNDMAHGDFVQDVGRDEAEAILELMAEVLNEVFQSPARVAKRTAARLASKDES